MSDESGLESVKGARKVMKFALPTIIMMVLTSSYVMVDGLIVANLIGTDALAAANLTMPVYSFFTAVGFMFASGGSALVSKKMGEGRTAEARSDFTLISVVAVIMAVAIIAVCLVFLDPLVDALGADETLHDLTKEYMLYWGGFAPFAVLQFIFIQFFVVVGKPGLALAAAVGSGITNICLDLLFIGGLGTGIGGAAVASGISSLIPCAIGFYFFTGGRSALQFGRPNGNRGILPKVCSNGASEMVTELSGSVASLAFNLVMMHYIGADGVGAITVIMYVQFLALAILLGYSMGVAPVMSHAYGRDDREAMSGLYRVSMKFTLAFSVAVFLFMEFFGWVVVGLFNAGNEHMYEIATSGILIHSFAYLFMGVNMYASSLFTSLSNGLLSAVISGLRSLIILVPLIVFLPAVMGVDGVWYAVPITDLSVMILSVWLLIRNSNRYGYGRLFDRRQAASRTFIKRDSFPSDGCPQNRLV